MSEEVIKLEFIIHGKLPSLNEYQAACRANKYQGAKFKKEVEEFIGWEIRSALCRGAIIPTKKPIRLEFKWHERTKKRDADNIASAKKFILDAMQKQGVIPNDSRRYVKGFSDDIVDDTSDFVSVKIIVLQTEDNEGESGKKTG